MKSTFETLKGKRQQHFSYGCKGGGDVAPMETSVRAAHRVEVRVYGLRSPQNSQLTRMRAK